MKVHTQAFKEQIKEMGRELDSKIIYSLNGETIELGNEDLNSITPHYEANILKSVMKQLDLDSNVDIPLNTVLNYQFGVKIGSEYEYLNFGNYVVYSSEKQEDTNSYKIICYDKMLYSMKNYEKFTEEYPMTVNDYIDKLCTHLNLTFKNKDDDYANKDKIIENELYLDNEGNDLGYTYRDVFDELAQVTASTIVIDEKTDEVEIRYINDTEDTIDEEYFKDVNVNFGEKYGPVNSIVLSRAGESDNIYLQDEKSIEENGLCEIKISENQIMNFNNRDEFLLDILEKLNGLEYYINDYESYGIMYYNVCDKYNVSIGNTTYSCIMFNDDIKITQGLGETVYCEMPDESETDYTKADKTDRKINQTYIIANKQEGKIEAVVNETINLKNTVNSNYIEIKDSLNNYAPNTALEEITNEVKQITTSTYTKTEVQQIVNGTGVDGVKVTYVVNTSGTFDINGLTIDKNNSPTKGRLSDDGLKIIQKLSDGSDGDTILSAIYNPKKNQTEVTASNLIVKNFLVIDNVSRFQKYVENGQTKIGCFWTDFKMLPFPITTNYDDQTIHFFTYNNDNQTVYSVIEGSHGTGYINLILLQTVYNVEIRWNVPTINLFEISIKHLDGTYTNYINITLNSEIKSGKFIIPEIKKGEILQVYGSVRSGTTSPSTMTIVSYE